MSPLDHNKNKKTEKVVYKTNWKYIAAAAAGGAFSVLLFNHVTREKINGGGFMEIE